MNKNKNGQVLVMLVVFVSIMVAVTSMAVSLLVTNSSSVTKFERGLNLLQVAESGTEMALLKILRDPINYSGETFTIDGASVTVNISGQTTKNLVATAVLGDYKKMVQLTLNVPIDGPMVITSWKEVY